MKKLRITLLNCYPFINSKGGVEKVFCMMANELVKQGHTVNAICFDRKKGEPPFPLDPQVNFINLGFNRVPFLLKKLIFKLRCIRFQSADRKHARSKLNIDILKHQAKDLLRNLPTDIFIAFQADTAIVIQKLLAEHDPKIIMMLHNIPSVYPILNDFPSILSKVTVTQVLRPEYADMVHQSYPTMNVVCIPNIVPQFAYTADRSAKKIIFVGRMSKEKRPHLVLESFALIKNQFPDWTLELWGGFASLANYKNELLGIMHKYNLHDQVSFCGCTDDIPSVLSKSSIFISTSEYEGFPLALTEAMSMGLACIGCKEASGVNTLIENNINGLLMDSTPNSLAKGLSMLMQDEELRIRMGDHAKTSMKQFDEASVWQQWFKLIDSVAHPS